MTLSCGGGGGGGGYLFTTSAYPGQRRGEITESRAVASMFAGEHREANEWKRWKCGASASYTGACESMNRK